MRAARAGADADEAERTASVLDPAIADRKLKAYRQHRQRIAEDRSSLTIEIARLEEGAKTQGGAGPASRAEAAREALALSAADMERFTKEAAVLRLLKDTLDSATVECFAPVFAARGQPRGSARAAADPVGVPVVR